MGGAMDSFLKNENLYKALDEKVGFRNKKAMVYESIKQKIIEVALPPGLPINESALARMLNVSKTPVREAVQQLERENLVENISGRGSYVTPVSFEYIHDIFEMREVLECGAAKRAVLVVDGEEIQSRMAMMEQSEPFLSDTSQSEGGSAEDIHTYIVRMLRNKGLMMAYSRVLDHIARIRNFFADRIIANRFDKIRAEHMEIYKALLARDPDRAERVVQEHLRNAASYIKNVVRL